MCRDWNGSMKCNVCKFLLSQGFVSTYDIAHHYVDTSGGPCKVFRFHRCLFDDWSSFSQADAWLVTWGGQISYLCLQCVSHHNHRGNIGAVDFVWLLNPNVYRKPLKRSFMEALLANVYVRRINLSNDFLYSPLMY